MSAGRHPTREQDATIERLSLAYGGLLTLKVSPPFRTSNDVRVTVRAANGGQTAYDVAPDGTIARTQWLTPEQMSS